MSVSEEITKRSIVSANSFSYNVLHYSSPWVTAWWSMAFPGIGHFMVNSYILGFFLLANEMILNQLSSLNTSIVYSFLGDFETAKEVLNKKWVLAYMPGYLFSIWDSYRRTVEINKIYKLAYREEKKIKSFHFSPTELNLLEKKQPWLALFWSFLMPGSGHMYVQRLWAIILASILGLFIINFSNMYEGMYYTAVGNFVHAKKVLNPQWVLYIPSLLGYAMYHSYVLAVENNKLFDLAQANFLKNNYQNNFLKEISRFK